jgi:hypothetical protein
MSTISQILTRLFSPKVSIEKMPIASLKNVLYSKVFYFNLAQKCLPYYPHLTLGKRSLPARVAQHSSVLSLAIYRSQKYILYKKKTLTPYRFCQHFTGLG